MKKREYYVILNEAKNLPLLKLFLIENNNGRSFIIIQDDKLFNIINSRHIRIISGSL